MRKVTKEPRGDPFAHARRALFPPLRNALLARAAHALSENSADDAKAFVQKVLEKNPADPDALNLLADIARREGNFEESERLLARCVSLSPASAGFRYNHAIILRRLDRFDEALAEIEVLLKSAARNPLYRDQKALILSRLGRHSEVLVIRRELAEENPDSAELWLEYAHGLRVCGCANDCISAYRKVLTISPSSASAYSQLADLKTYRFVEPEIRAMEKLISEPGRSPAERSDLHSALGNAYDDRNMHAKAFEHYAKGNALRRLDSDYDCEAVASYARICEGVFTSGFFREREGWGNSSQAPIFVVGMPRSGSTLIEQILSSHSSVQALGEQSSLDSVFGRYLSDFEGGRPEHEFWIGGRFEFRRGLLDALPRALAGADANVIRAIAADYLGDCDHRRIASARHFTDKGLRNFGHVGLIALILPQARIIDARRHPLDCGWSCFRSNFSGGQPFAYRLSDIGRVYATYIRLMNHFERVLPGRVYHLQYEDLVENPETEIRRLLDHVGLEFQPQCLRFHENRRPIVTPSSEQVRKPLYDSGVGQWRAYETWLGPLKSALGAALQNYVNVAETLAPGAP